MPTRKTTRSRRTRSRSAHRTMSKLSKSRKSRRSKSRKSHRTKSRKSRRSHRTKSRRSHRTKSRRSRRSKSRRSRKTKSRSKSRRSRRSKSRTKSRRTKSRRTRRTKSRRSRRSKSRRTRRTKSRRSHRTKSRGGGRDDFVSPTECPYQEYPVRCAKKNQCVRESNNCQMSPADIRLTHNYGRTYKKTWKPVMEEIITHAAEMPDRVQGQRLIEVAKRVAEAVGKMTKQSVSIPFIKINERNAAKIESLMENKELFNTKAKDLVAALGIMLTSMVDEMQTEVGEEISDY